MNNIFFKFTNMNFTCFKIYIIFLLYFQVIFTFGYLNGSPNKFIYVYINSIILL